jgi:8-oxo-dGTP pyrophosphatase MutT (NUDIX family)
VPLPSYDLETIARLLRPRGAALDSSSPERQAAVAAVLRAPLPSGDAEILLVRRSERAGDPWSGHMAFPGGRRDDSDPTLLATAIRETREEVGLDLDQHGTLLARLPDTPAVARGRRVGIVISPFVFALNTAAELPPELRLNDEIAEAIWAPLGPLARGELATTHAYSHEGKHFDLPGFQVGERIVWGLTYHMLQALLEVLHAR